jgi:hypothetical protein
VKIITFTKIGNISYFHRDGRKTDSSKLTLTKWFHKNPKIKLGPKYFKDCSRLSRAPVEKLTLTQLVDKSTTFNRTSKFSTILSLTQHWNSFWAWYIQFTSSHAISILILSFYIWLGAQITNILNNHYIFKISCNVMSCFSISDCFCSKCVKS